MGQNAIGPTAKQSGRTARRTVVHCVIVAALLSDSAFVTWIEPISVITFSRAGRAINGNVTELFMFVVPYRQSVIEGVTAVRDEFRNSETQLRQETRFGTRLTQVHQTAAFLVIASDTDEVTIPVSQVNIDDVLHRAKSFQGTGGPPKIRIVTVSNWKATICSGLIMFAALLYLPFIIWRRRVRSSP